MRALSRWRGPALEEFAAEPFARAEAARLDALRLRAVEDRFAADLALGRHAAVLPELAAAIVGEPLRERFREQLIVALYRCGRQAEALDAYADACATLADQVGVDPGAALSRLHVAVLHHDPRLDLPVPPVHIAAPPTSFIGRARDLVEARTRMRAGRVVTLTGVGGVGKSRLALETAVAFREDFPDGSWIAELAPLTRSELVAPAVAAALGVREHPRRDLTSVLADRLSGAAGLLVLDSCEHVLDEVAMLVGQLSAACPRLRIPRTDLSALGRASPGDRARGGHGRGSRRRAHGGPSRRPGRHVDPGRPLGRAPASHDARCHRLEL